MSVTQANVLGDIVFEYKDSITDKDYLELMTILHEYSQHTRSEEQLYQTINLINLPDDLHIKILQCLFNIVVVKVNSINNIDETHPSLQTQVNPQYVLEQPRNNSQRHMNAKKTCWDIGVCVIIIVIIVNLIRFFPT